MAVDEQQAEMSTKLKIYEVVGTHYRNDFTLFWQRTNFFLLINAGLFWFVLSAASNTDVKVTMMKVVASLTGLLISVVWFGVSRSSIVWIQVWREQFVRIDQDINPYKSFENGDNAARKDEQFHQYFRPEELSTIMPIGFAIAWLWMLVHRLIS